MEMGHEEIKISYRNAKQKKKQLGILADLNCCSREEIKKIVQEAEDSPDNDIIHRLYNRLDFLDREIRERETEYKKIVIALEVLSKNRKEKKNENRRFSKSF